MYVLDKNALNRLWKDERGIALVESLMAVAILGCVVLMMVMGIGGGMMSVQAEDRDTVAQALARTELEYVKTCVYDSGAVTYPAVSAPEGYSIVIAVSPVPGAADSIQKITVEILHEGETVLTVEDYKSDR